MFPESTGTGRGPVSNGNRNLAPRHRNGLLNPKNLHAMFPERRRGSFCAAGRGLAGLYRRRPAHMAARSRPAGLKSGMGNAGMADGRTPTPDSPPAAPHPSAADHPSTSENRKSSIEGPESPNPNPDAGGDGERAEMVGSEDSNLQNQSRQVIENTGEVSENEQNKPNF
jgi:hypothetical protein